MQNQDYSATTNHE